MTAVIEFLTAFVLFLVIVSAFLSLSQLRLGPNLPGVDRLDEDAVSGLRLITSSSGWWVEHGQNGTRDASNGSSDWHLISADRLASADVLPGLAAADGDLDESRLRALYNVTQSAMRDGLGLDFSVTFNLTVTIVESPNQSKVGEVLFSDGADRRGAIRSSTASRLMPIGSDIARVTLEVMESSQLENGLRITEFSPDPSMGAPEWIEIHNSGGFAIELLGWGVERNGLHTLVGEGVLPGDGVLILTGDAVMQERGNATLVIDIAATGMLGRGGLDGLKVPGDTLRLTHNEVGSATTIDVEAIRYDHGWGFDSDESARWADSRGSTWVVDASSSPGDV